MKHTVFCYINIINCEKPSIVAWQATDRGMYEFNILKTKTALPAATPESF